MCLWCFEDGAESCIDGCMAHSTDIVDYEQICRISNAISRTDIFYMEIFQSIFQPRKIEYFFRIFEISKLIELMFL